METKLSQVKAAAASGDWEKAICMAAKFPNLGKEGNEIRTAADCIKYPDFYRQIKKDCSVLIESGKAALKEKYKIN